MPNVKVLWERNGNCLWHCNCTGHFQGSGIMRMERTEEARSLLTCLQCGVQTWAAHGLRDGEAVSFAALAGAAP